jgi:hypothetical protein
MLSVSFPWIGLHVSTLGQAEARFYRAHAPMLPFSTWMLRLIWKGERLEAISAVIAQALSVH